MRVLRMGRRRVRALRASVPVVATATCGAPVRGMLVTGGAVSSMTTPARRAPVRGMLATGRAVPVMTTPAGRALLLGLLATGGASFTEDGPGTRSIEGGPAVIKGWPTHPW